MPVRIRLARHGRKSRPFYYIVVADSRAPRDGKFIERIGSYNPITNPATLELDFDKALDWLQKGAQPSDTARNLLQQKGVMYKNHLLKGVAKGALTEEQAEKKYQDWISQKENELSEVARKIKDGVLSEEKARMAAETKIRESMAAELAKKRSELVAADAVLEEAPEEAAEEVAEVQEPEAAAVEEAPAPVAEEAPAEVVEETQAEEKTEAPAEVVIAEEKPEVVAEMKEEEPAKEEASEEEKTEEEKSAE